MYTILKSLSLCAAIFILFGPPYCLAGDAGMEARARRLAEKLKKEGGAPFTGFYELCAVGDAGQVKKAIAEGADVNAGDPDHGQTPPLAVAAGNNPACFPWPPSCRSDRSRRRV